MKKKNTRRIYKRTAIGFVVAAFALLFCVRAGILARETEEADAAVEKERLADADLTEEPAKEERKPEDEVYSYLQGVKSYERGKEWSGAWCYEEAGGQQFSQFGCGLCSMANVYSTVSKNQCTPLQMYEYAQEASSYNPHGGLGAIGWDAMRVTLQKMGLECEVGRKTASYEEFCQLARESQCLIVLISSENDDIFWEEMPGHYVTLWLYSEEDEMVFLSDSSGPSRNRKWIPLQYAYDALKVSSPQQYLRVTGYEKTEDQWRKK